MHEFSICGLLLKALTEEYDRIEPTPTGLKSATVVIGGLHQVVPDYLQGAWNALTTETPYAGAELILEFLEVRGACSACDWEGTIQPPLFVCPQCSTPGVEIRQGKEMFLKKLEVQT